MCDAMLSQTTSLRYLQRPKRAPSSPRALSTTLTDDALAFTSTRTHTETEPGRCLPNGDSVAGKDAQFIYRMVEVGNEWPLEVLDDGALEGIGPFKLQTCANKWHASRQRDSRDLDTVLAVYRVTSTPIAEPVDSDNGASLLVS